MYKLKKSIKSFAICILLFIMLTSIISLLMQTGIMSEKTAKPCMYMMLAICCFILGILYADIFSLMGILTGTGISILFVAFIWCVISAAFGAFNVDSLADKLNLIPVFAGMIGGIIGSNIKK